METKYISVEEENLLSMKIELNTNIGKSNHIELKACPRCSGDLHMDKDVFGHYRKCLQCGYMLDIKNREVLVSP
jgi:uncharacterized protein YbaR (Trm112 family)